MKKKNKTVNLSLQVVPINESNAYPIIDEAIKVIQNAGIKHEVQPFSTIMEGELEELLKIVVEAKNAALSAGADELLLNIQVHLKKEQSVAFKDKTQKYHVNLKDTF